MIIDAHAHIEWNPNATASFAGGRDAAQIALGDRLGIEVFACSCLAPRPSRPETFRQGNDRMIAALKEFKGRIWGYCYVNPGFAREALEEIERCLQIEDVVGVKLYNEYHFDDPVVRPIIEKCIELDCPILEHQGHVTDPLPGQRNISDAGNLSRAANAYPEAKLILGHICGGGDWEWTVKQAATAPTLYADTSGSVSDEGTLEMAVREMGAERLLFACDGSLSTSVGRMRAAQIAEEEKAMIWGGNFLRLVGRGG